ncbi:hypothetical protein BLNAU_22074 [Blattamonas nauphoetae]|uniref:DDE-1 domain-containing protein n=1 Tax=Blattamonas nauphoetae TaxID=2049346 RepID=A0ABQ9WU21_9EUKA|nr:hypothetical protein BLNAU_22074 [Blattamonas nauphoetae]
MWNCMNHLGLGSPRGSKSITPAKIAKEHYSTHYPSRFVLHASQKGWMNQEILADILLNSVALEIQQRKFKMNLQKLPPIPSKSKQSTELIPWLKKVESAALRSLDNSDAIVTSFKDTGIVPLQPAVTTSGGDI